MRYFSDVKLNAIANKALFVASAAMALFFVSFVWVAIQATQAMAQSDVQCQGANLIEVYRAERPEALAQIETEASKIENGNSIFWKVEKEGVPTSWMLGTMHMADERILNLNDEKLAAFDQASTIIVESTDALDPAKAQAAMASLAHLTFSLPGDDLSNHLDEATLAKLKPAIESRGIPFAIASKLKPWLVATTIALPACEIAAKQSGKVVMDALIGQKAKEAGKKLVGLETIEEQFTAIATLPEEFHLTALKETLELGDQTADIMETMKLLYLDGKISWVMPLMKVATPKTEGAEESNQFQEQLILKRNVIMAERSAKLFENGGAFLAVGALHLPGEQGLVSLLRKQGYTVTAQ